MAPEQTGIPALRPPSFLLTVDVEDWFQVENFKAVIPFSSWEERELRVERNTHRLLDLFDEMRESAVGSLQPGSQAVPLPCCCATFFILGWIAERLPGLVREIQKRGHEVASHGFDHHLCSQQDGVALREDLARSKKLLEDITGHGVFGYRAPSFSVSNEILKVIEDVGYRYDASYNSFGSHGRYGKLSLSGFEKTGIAYRVSDQFYEIPVSNVSFQPSAASRQPIVVPWSGGGYFRLIPLNIFIWGVRKILEGEEAYHFYFHPWEIDAGQPRVEDVSRTFKFRHYVNIGRTLDKLKTFMLIFKDARFQTLSGYLDGLKSFEKAKS